jgi:hypothetical protein
MMARRARFPASKVTITPVFLVDCEVCGAVNLALGDALTRDDARRLKADHVEKHRSVDPDCPRCSGAAPNVCTCTTYCGFEDCAGP